MTWLGVLSGWVDRVIVFGLGVRWRCCPASCPAKVPVVTCKLALVAGFELWTGTQAEVGSNLASEVVRIFHQS